jgi:hypothetical protein
MRHAPAISSAALLLALAATVTGCGPARKATYYSVNRDGTRSQRYSRVNEYTSYGELGAQTKIAEAYEAAQHAPPPDLEIEVHNASLPGGVSIDDGVIKIADGAPYHAVGRFEIGYWRDSAPKETEIRDDLIRLASVTSSNVVVVEITRFGHADERVDYISGLLLRRTGDAALQPPAPGGGASAGAAARSSGFRATARPAYRANGPRCSTADEFADEVSARLGYSPWLDSAATAVRAEISGAESDFRATITVGNGEPKRLTGASCRAVTDAAIAVVLVHLDRAADGADDSM